jgi:4-hydroxy-3-methylbut-2-enyl diphosphate reductase
VLGGKNSSNTYQLYRLCEQRLDGNAFFIQSERNILSRAAVEHHHYVGGGAGRTDPRTLWPENATGAHPAPKRVLITGGASCPDGIIQQVITRINGFFPPGQLRSVADVLRDLEPASG